MLVSFRSLWNYRIIGKLLRQSCSGLYPENLELWRSSRMERAQPLWAVSSTAWLSAGWKRVSLKNTVFPYACCLSFPRCAPQQRWLHVVDKLLRGTSRLHLFPSKAISPPGWTSPGPSASPNRKSITDLRQLEGPPSFLCWRDPTAWSIQKGA